MTEQRAKRIAPLAERIHRDLITGDTRAMYDSLCVGTLPGVATKVADMAWTLAAAMVDRARAEIGEGDTGGRGTWQTWVGRGMERQARFWRMPGEGVRQWGCELSDLDTDAVGARGFGETAQQAYEDATLP